MVNLDDYDAPERPDFRRIGKDKIPYVMGLSGRRERYGRSSNSGKILDDESTLTKWKLRTVVAGAAQRPELMAKAAVLDIDIDKRELNDIAEECIVSGKGQRRAIIGVAVHAMFDHLDRNDGWKPPPNYAALCNAYQLFKAEWGLIPVGIEIHCINDRYRVAGTLDRRFITTKTLVTPDGKVIPIGTVIVVDFKTGKELEYAAGSYSTQLAAYVDSLEYDVITDERKKFDPPNFPDWALIIHADSAGTEIGTYWVDIAQGREGLELANSVKDWRRRDSLLTRAPEPAAPEPPVADGPPEPPTSPPEPPEPPAAVPVPPEPPEPPRGSRTDDKREHLRARIRTILDHSELAAKQLQREWPQGIPGLKYPGHTWEQLSLIEESIENVERDFSLPFGETWQEPVAISMMRHPSNTTRIIHRLQNHKRIDLLNSWVERNPDLILRDDAPTVTTALLAFADFDVHFEDAEIEMCLLGAIRNINEYATIDNLRAFLPDEFEQLTQLGIGISNGTAMLMFDYAGKPMVRMLSEIERK